MPFYPPITAKLPRDFNAKRRRCQQTPVVSGSLVTSPAGQKIKSNFFHIKTHLLVFIDYHREK